MFQEDFQQWFNSREGKILSQNESCFLKHAITVSYTRNILQLGDQSWEDQYIDCTAYRGFFVLNKSSLTQHKCPVIQGLVESLPIASDSIDLVILPHLLEFETNRYQILREVERILKPEGELIVLSFNPWCIFSIKHFCLRAVNIKNRHLRFISRSRIINWLNLLNFDAEVVAGFDFDQTVHQYQQCLHNKNALWSSAYAIHAIKRRFHMIPLNDAVRNNSTLAFAGSNFSSIKTTRNE